MPRLKDRQSEPKPASEGGSADFMERFINHILDQVAGQGLSMAFTIVAVYYLYGKIKECEADRKALWERLFEHTESNK